MTLSKEQIDKLIRLVASTTDDQMDCDGCFSKVAEFAEIKLADQPIPAAMKCIENHMENCPCCADEFNALLEALSGLREGDTP